MPEDLGLADERRHAPLLELPRRRVPHDEVDRLERVLAGSRHPGPEVRQHLGAHPGVVTLPGLDPLRHEVRREEFGQRRGDRLDQAALADQLHVAVACEAHARQDGAAARHLLPVEPDALGQAEPERETALALLLAVVVLDPPDPRSAERGVLRLRQDDRVLDRDARLVVVAVQHPLLELEARQLPVVHEGVVAVVIVIAGLALAPQPLHELVAGKRCAVAHAGLSVALPGLSGARPSSRPTPPPSPRR